MIKIYKLLLMRRQILQMLSWGYFSCYHTKY